MLQSIRLSRREQHAGFVLFLIVCLGYAYELSNFNLSIDDEFLAFGNICSFVDLGRWVHPLVHALWPRTVVPSGPFLLFAAGMALGFVYVARSWGIQRFRFFHYAVFAAYALFPTWLAQLEFAANVLPVGLGVLCVSMATWLTVRAEPMRAGWPVARLLVAALLCAVAIGCYQSLGLLYSAWVVGAALLGMVGTEASCGWRTAAARVGLGLMVFLAATVLSLLVAKLALMACQIDVAAYAAERFKLSALWTQPRHVANAFVRDLGRPYHDFWRSYPPAGSVFSLTLLGCGAFCVASAGRSRWLAVLAGLSLLVMIPAAFTVVVAEFMPARTYFASAASLAIVLLLAYRSARSSIGRGIVTGLACLVAVQGLYVNSVEQARGWVVQQYDRALAHDIHRAIAQLGLGQDGAPSLVQFGGHVTFHSVYPSAPTVTTGASFFEWDGGDRYRMVSYMRLVGYTQYKAVDDAQAKALLPELAEMPSWPAPGSVRRVGDVALVKLSAP